MRKPLILALVFLCLVVLGRAPGRTVVTAAPELPLAGDTERVSVRSNGDEANDNSDAADITADGRYVAFESVADNLVSGDDNDRSDIFVYDREEDEIERVSVSTDGDEGNFNSFAPAISDDGHYVIFQSFATNLVDGDNNGVADIFLHSRRSGSTRLVSVGMNGQWPNDISYDPDVSEDGEYVVFWSYADNLVANDNNNRADVFRYNTQDRTTVRISVDSNGVAGNGDSQHPVISSDGQRVAFESFASNLVAGDSNGYKDVFFRSLNSGRTSRVSVDSDGDQANGESFGASISGDGRYVAFTSLATNLVSDDDNGYPDVFIRDRNQEKTRLVSLSSDEDQGNNWSRLPSLSQDGRYVAFQSDANDLVSDDTNGVQDIFVRDRQEGTTVVASVSSSGQMGNEPSQDAVMAGDARAVAFTSAADNLVSDDDNNDRDIFVHNLEEPSPPPPPPPPPPTLAVNYAIGAPGSTFTFSGANYTPSGAYAVWVNGTLLGTGTADTDGNLAFQVCTESGSDEGGYFATVIQGETAVTAGFMLTASAPVRPATGNGPTFCVPDGIAYTEFSYLPLAFR